MRPGIRTSLLVARLCLGSQVESQEEGIGSYFAAFRGWQYGTMFSLMSAPPRALIPFQLAA